MESYYNIIDYILHAVHFILWLTYFVTGSLYLLISLTHFFHSPTSFLSGNHLFVLCIYDSVSVLLCLFICFAFLDSIHKWKYMIFVFLWLISLSIIPSTSLYVVANDKISFFFMAE